MEPVIVNTCNAWQEYASFTFVGVYTNLAKFKKEIKRLVKEDIIDLEEEVEIKDLDFTDIDRLQMQLRYVNFNPIILNESEL